MNDNSNITPELLETVERYYNGKMAQQDRIQFEQQLDKDPTFKTSVEDIRTIILGIETQALKEQFDHFHNELPKHNPLVPSTPPTRFPIFAKMAIAAGIIIAFGMFWHFNGTSNERLYAKYFTPDPGLPTTMSASDNFAFYDAMVNYKQGDYTTAISKWEKLELKAPENDTINYFLGVAHLADKNPEKAVSYLNKTTKNAKSVFIEDAYYYLGLAYLKSNKKEEASESFRKSQSDKSQEILNRLD